MLAARNWGRKKYELLFEYRVSLLQDEKNSGDG